MSKATRRKTNTIALRQIVKSISGAELTKFTDFHFRVSKEGYRDFDYWPTNDKYMILGDSESFKANGNLSAVLKNYFAQKPNIKKKCEYNMNYDALLENFGIHEDDRESVYCSFTPLVDCARQEYIQKNFAAFTRHVRDWKMAVINQ